jgi:putative acetyltransferase
MLTPLAVRPDRQRLGIGTQLMDHALKSLEARGETLFSVLGPSRLLPAFRLFACCSGCESVVR